MKFGYINVDWHLHACFPSAEKAARLKARQYWQQFANIGLDAVLLTEHQYLDPERAYSIMVEEKPKDSNVLLFAGIELLCRANSDESPRQANAELVISTVDPSGFSLYEKPFILHPGILTLEEAIQAVMSDSSLDCYIPHPYILGRGRAVRCLGENELYRILYQYPYLGIEIHNGSFNLVYSILNRNPRISAIIEYMETMFFRGTQYFPTIDRIKKIIKTPAKLLFDKNNKMITKFFSGGSDAHFPKNMTSHLVVPIPAIPPRDSMTESSFRLHVYQAIVNNKSQHIVFHTSIKSIFWFLLQWATLIKENFIKKRKKKILSKYLSL